MKPRQPSASVGVTSYKLIRPRGEGPPCHYESTASAAPLRPDPYGFTVQPCHTTAS